MCSLRPFSLDAEQEDEDLHVVVKKSGTTVMIDKEIEEISREFQFNSSLAQHFTSDTNSTPIHATESITSLMLSCRNAIRHPKQSAKQNPQDLQCHRHNSSTHIMHQSQVIMNTC